jgi:hypothetical protein
VERATPGALIGSGKISPIRIPEAGAPGAGEEEYEDVFEGDYGRQCCRLLCGCANDGNYELTITILNAPLKKNRRPNLSMVQKGIGVERTLTRVVIREIRIGS